MLAWEKRLLCKAAWWVVVVVVGATVVIPLVLGGREQEKGRKGGRWEAKVWINTNTSYSRSLQNHISHKNRTIRPPVFFLILL